MTERKVRFLPEAMGCACCGVRFHRLWFDGITETSKCWACLSPAEREWRLPMYKILCSPNELPLRMQAWANLRENLECRNADGCNMYTA